MKMVGQTNGFIRRGYKHKNNSRWLYVPPKKREKDFSFDGLFFYFQVCATVFALVFSIGYLWICLY